MARALLNSSFMTYASTISLLAGAALALACSPAAPAPAQSPLAVQSSPVPTSWTVELNAEVAQPAAATDFDAPEAYELSVQLRDSSGVLVEAFDLGGFQGECVRVCDRAAQGVLELRCWENIPGVPTAHYTVKAEDRGLWVTTVAGECGYESEKSERLHKLPPGVALRAVNDSCG